MDELLRFLQKYEIWIYIILGIGSLVYIQRMLVSWNEWRNTVFGLERESAQRKLSTALTILILMALLIISEFMIVSFVIPSMPQPSLQPTPTLDILATPTATLPAASGTATPEGVQPTLAPSGVGCTPGVIEWNAPKAGETISASIELSGTINVPNLGFYKYEYAPVGSETWTTIAAGNNPLINGYIGTWNTTPLVPGDYQLRLVVADNQNNLFPACVVQVRIVSP